MPINGVMSIEAIKEGINGVNNGVFRLTRFFISSAVKESAGNAWVASSLSKDPTIGWHP